MLSFESYTTYQERRKIRREDDYYEREERRKCISLRAAQMRREREALEMRELEEESRQRRFIPQARANFEREMRIHERDVQFEKDVHTFEQKVEEVNQSLFNIQQLLEQWEKANMKSKGDEIQPEAKVVNDPILEDLIEIESIHPVKEELSTQTENENLAPKKDQDLPILVEVGDHDDTCQKEDVLFHEESFNPKEDEILLNYDDILPTYDEYDDNEYCHSWKDKVGIVKEEDFKALSPFKEFEQEVDFIFGESFSIFNNEENSRTNFFEEGENDEDPRGSKLGFKHDGKPMEIQITWLSRIGLYWPKLGPLVYLITFGPIGDHSAQTSPLPPSPLVLACFHTGKELMAPFHT